MSVLSDLQKVKEMSTKDVSGLFAEINTQLSDKNSAEVAIVALSSILSAKNCAPHFIGCLPKLLELSGEKKPKTLADNAANAAKELISAVATKHNVYALADVTLEGVAKGKVPVKLLKLTCFDLLVDVAPIELVEMLPKIVPLLTEAMWDTKKQVREAAVNVLKKAATNVTNRDIEPFIPEMVNAIQNPDLVVECVHKLGSTAFVQTVEASVLAISVPILLRGFAEKSVAIKRLCAKITGNMVKLIERAGETAQFLPGLMPILNRLKEEISDSECRGVCENAYKQLQRIEELAKSEAAAGKLPVKTLVDNAISGNKTLSKISKKDKFSTDIITYIGHVSHALLAAGTDDVEIKSALKSHFDSVNSAKELNQYVKAVMKGNANAEEEEEVDDGLENLCDCKFTLAFGTKILLNNTRFKLNRGHRVALVGAQGCGKTALMQAIASDNLDGFPPKEVLKTVFVQHDIQGDMTAMSVIDFCLQDPMLIEMNVTREQVVTMLTEIGLTKTMRNGLVTALSGGWKMKLALGRAKLKLPDILLLDEPTNHLDVVNVKWIEDFLLENTNITSLIVSHDTKFMDNVATHVIHFESLRLKSYVGNLSAFVEKVPSAKSYYTLENKESKFLFPPPGFIDGVNRRTKHLLTMQNVAYTYPTATSPQFTEVNLRLSMASRVAIVGRNGAGKSTLIRLVTGETVPDTGSGACWRHPNLKLAYVAQHAFHHIEQHLGKTPNEYIRWRFQGGKDKENMKKMNLKLSEEELKLQATPIEITMESDEGKKKSKAKKEKRVIEKIVSRRKNKKDFDYEVQWMDKPSSMNVWYGRLFLERYGWKKVLDEVDRKAVEAAGKYVKPLTLKNVEEHLSGCGLEREFASYTRISALSGGQKVKVVLAAAMWDQPHILLLDEPTNFLDRESLAGLAGAINEFEGGVVVITHHREFRDAVCKTSWIMENNKLTVMGDDEDWFDSTTKVETEEKEEMTDAFGNTVKLEKSVKALSRKEIRKLQKQYKKLKKEGADVTHLEDMFMDLNIDF